LTEQQNFSEKPFKQTVCFQQKTAGVGQLFDLIRSWAFGLWSLKNQRPKIKNQRPKKYMKCEDLQFNLPIYFDEALNETERANLDAHLVSCPVCRQKLADFQNIKNNLRVMPRPMMSADLLNSVRAAVAYELETPEPKRIFSEDFRRWLQMSFMPYTVGVATTFLFMFLLLSAMLSGANSTQTTQVARNESSKIMLVNSNTSSDFTFTETEEKLITQQDFARNRMAVSGESPSLNPTGAIVELTKSLVRGKMKGDEFVVVADVFDNGLARIAEVVESPQDLQTIEELNKAFNADADNAPFLPASLDHRASEVRVIFKIQLVDVQTSKPKNKKVKR